MQLRHALILALIALASTHCSDDDVGNDGAARDNRSPLAVAGEDITTRPGEIVTLDGSGSSDPDGDPLTFTWSLEAAPGNTTASLRDDGETSATLTVDALGTFVVALTVSDGLSQSVDVLTVFVSEIETTVGEGETVRGVGGVALTPADGAVADPLPVAIEEGNTGITPLPDRVTAESAPVVVRAGRDVYAQGEGFFRLEIPVPESAPRDELALALLTPPEDLVADFRAEGGQSAAGAGLRALWEFLPGKYDADRSVFVTTLPRLTFDGRALALVSSPQFDSQIDSTRQSFEQFAITCVDFAEFADASDCTATERDALASALEDAYADYTPLGFPEPYLKREVISSGPNNATVGGYEGQLHPFRTVDVDNDELGLCEGNGSVTNLGMYSSGSKILYVCINDTVTTGTIGTARHEYFHATQYAFPAVRDNSRDAWIIEGTASASENSLAAMARMNRPLHPVEEPLTSDEDLLEYQAQDFWVFLGQRLNRGLGYLIDVYDEGANTAAVERALRSQPGAGSLEAAYWAWVKNQAIEVENDLDGAISGGPCSPVNATTSPEVVSYAAGDGPRSESYTLDALDSVLVEIDFGGSSIPYTTRLVTPLTSTALEVKYYRAARAGTSACFTRLALPEERVVLGASDTETVYALISNTEADGPKTATLSLNPEPRVNATVSETYREVGGALDLRADISGFTDPANVEITWTFETTGNGQETMLSATTGDGETLSENIWVCDSLLWTVEARDAATGEEATTLATSRCIPQVEDTLYFADLSKSGQIREDGQATLASATTDLTIGDSSSNEGIHANLHFPLLIPDDVSVSEAFLTLNFRQTNGNPYTTLGSLNVVHCDYGDSLDSGDYRSSGNVTFLPGLTSVPINASGLTRLNVTTAVADALTRGEKVQFVVYFSQGTDSNGSDDNVEISSENGANLLRPTLEIRYENY